MYVCMYVTTSYARNLTILRNIQTNSTCCNYGVATLVGTFSDVFPTVDLQWRFKDSRDRPTESLQTLPETLKWIRKICCNLSCTVSPVRYVQAANSFHTPYTSAHFFVCSVLFEQSIVTHEQKTSRNQYPISVGYGSRRFPARYALGCWMSYSSCPSCFRCWMKLLTYRTH